MADPQTIGQVSAQIQSSMQSITTLLTGMGYLSGIAFGMKAALKFKEHNENPENVALSQPIMLMIVSSMMLSLPSFLSTSSSVLFPPMDAKTKAVESAGSSAREVAAVDPAVEARKAVEAANAKVVVEQVTTSPVAPVEVAKIPDSKALTSDVRKSEDVKIIREPAKGSSADNSAIAYVLAALSLLGLMGFGMAKRAAKKKSEENELASLTVELERAKDGIAPTRVER